MTAAGNAPPWVSRAPLGVARWELVRVTRRGVGMTLASTGFWVAMAAVSAFAGLDASALALFFVIASVLVYPAGYLLNRALGGDLLARGAVLRSLVVTVGLGPMLGWPLLAVLLLQAVPLVAFAVAAVLGAHFLPFGWLYRTPAYYALGATSVLAGAALQLLAPLQANTSIPLAMAGLYGAASVAVWRQNRRERVAC